MNNDTIFALATATGRAGIAILRVSGPGAFKILNELAGDIPPLRKAVLRNLNYKNEFIDQAIVICFKATSSYTGEDMVEFHIHGSNAVIKALSEILLDEFDISIAKPGEFTRRALDSGRMDLSQAEGLLSLIEAETKEQKKQALTCLSGVLGNKTNEWKSLILKGLSLVEIMIDFTDQDVPPNTLLEISAIIKLLAKRLNKELESYKNVELIRDGFDITIIGKPNVGKSSLLNYLAGREKAIVSDYAGTTRDLIELSIDLKGYQVNFFDTAGVHNSSDPVEKIGITRAIKKAQESDLRIFLLENNDKPEQFNIKVKKQDLFYSPKADLKGELKYSGISGKTGKGVDDMLETVSKRLLSEVKSNSVLINERHKNILKNIIVTLSTSEKELEKEFVEVEILAEHFRSIINQFDLLIGKINVEEVLGSIFSSFCIGK